MRRMMQFWFGAGLGNTVLAVVGFMGPGPAWAGFFTAGLAISCFVILGLVNNVDERARAEFISTLSRFRTVGLGDEKFQARIDELEAEIMTKKSLIGIAHEIGRLNGELIERGLISPNQNEKPETDV